MKILLVGELNPYGEDPAMALFPLPKLASGARLCRVLGLTSGEYLRRFDRMNLCTGYWSAHRAKMVAGDIRKHERCWARVVLLGAKVASAFGLKPWVPFTAVGRYVMLPHPSGRSRGWNEAGAAKRARELVFPREETGC